MAEAVHGAFLVWTQDYATGVRTIDGDHQVLFAMVNALHAVVRRGDRPNNLASLFRRLNHYVDGHFQREEQLMARADYPGLAAHRERHRELAAKLNDMLADYEAAPADYDAAALLAFLKDWLTEHVLKSDMDYVPYVAGEKG